MRPTAQKHRQVQAADARQMRTCVLSSPLFPYIIGARAAGVHRLGQGWLRVGVFDAPGVTDALIGEGLSHIDEMHLLSDTPAADGRGKQHLRRRLPPSELATATPAADGRGKQHLRRRLPPSELATATLAVDGSERPRRRPRRLPLSELATATLAVDGSERPKRRLRNLAPLPPCELATGE